MLPCLRLSLIWHTKLNVKSDRSVKHYMKDDHNAITPFGIKVMWKYNVLSKQECCMPNKNTWWCVRPHYMYWDSSYITLDHRSSVIWLGFQLLWPGFMHYSNCFVFLLCHCFIMLFISNDMHWCLSSWQMSACGRECISQY